MWDRAHVSESASGSRPARSVYPVRRGYFVRALGRGAIVTAVLMLLVTVCLAVPAPGPVTAVVVVVAAVALVLVAMAAVSVMMPPALLQMDQHGYRVSKRYTAGPRQAGWADVHAAASQQGPEGLVLIIQHHDGRHTAVPLSLTDAAADTVEQDVRDRLDQAHGYRPLP
jgi:hypothetical protein